LGKNISALEINGSFDDCQAIVKQAFTDADLNKKFCTYFCQLYQCLQDGCRSNCIISMHTSSGKRRTTGDQCTKRKFWKYMRRNFSTGVRFAHKHFIAACNANDVVPKFLETGNYQAKNSIATISNAMDVGNPSNFIRILELFHQQVKDLKSVLSSYSVDDTTTQQTIKEVFEKYNYVLDPHGAVGYYALNLYLNEHDYSPSENQGIFLETAHPVKFRRLLNQLQKTKIEIPKVLNTFLIIKSKALKWMLHLTRLRVDDGKEKSSMKDQI
jgi:threonine synthase